MYLRDEQYNRLQQVLSGDLEVEELEKVVKINIEIISSVVRSAKKMMKNTKILSPKHKMELDEILDTHEDFYQLRAVMWNEIKIDELVNWADLLIIAILLNRKYILSNTDLNGYIGLLYKNKMIDDEDLTMIVISYSPESIFDNFNLVKNFVIAEASLYGPLIPSYSKLVEVYKSRTGDEIEDFWNEVGLRIRSINERPEFIKDIMQVVDLDVLSEVMHWIPYDNRPTVLDYIISKRIENIESSEYENALSHGITAELPMSYNVLGESLANFPAQTIDENIYSKIHPDFVASWLPKYVYSHPETSDDLQILFPGGDGIGHSAIILKSNNGVILLDFGLSVVNNSSPRWMALLEKVDAVLLSHAHMDHSGSVPILFQNRKELPVFGTKGTKLITKMLWNDTKNILSRYTHEDIVSSDSVFQALTSHDCIMRAQENFVEVNLGETFSVLPNMTVRPFEAGHLFGSVGYEIDFNGKRLLYTGDFNVGGTDLLKPASFPKDSDMVVFDGTNYQKKSSSNGFSTFEEILGNSKRVIMPAFSVGRTQEMLYKLKQVKGIKDWMIVLTGMGGRLTKNLNLDMYNKMTRDISIMPTLGEDDFIERTIVIAGQGMLQAGTSRNLLEFSKDDEDTAVVFSGYQAPNTLGYHLLRGQPQLLSRYKQQFYRIKFSGHSTGDQLDKFLDIQDGRKIMVHSPEEYHRKELGGDISIPSNFGSRTNV